MKYNYLEPEKIIAVVICLIVLGVGVFSFFVTTTSLSTSGTVREATGNYGASTIKTITGNALGDATQVYQWLPCTGYSANVTTGVKLEAYNITTGYIGWTTIQAVGAANGTWIAGNSTYRVTKRTVAGILHWSQFRVTFSKAGYATGKIENDTWWSLKNSSKTGGSVFNVVCILIMISAIMAIIGVIYLYIKR